MLNNILLRNKSFVYNKQYNYNLYNYATPQVYHYVTSIDAYTCDYSVRRRNLYSIKNYIDKNKLRNVLFDFASLVGVELKMIALPSGIISEGLKKGTVKLNFVQSAVVLSTVEDTNEDGVLYQTVGPIAHAGEAVGLVLYEYGIILLYGNYSLSAVQENFRSMVTNYGVLPLVYDNDPFDPKWVYFANTGNPATNACPNSAFEIELETVCKLYKMTFLIDVENRNWSNNPTFHPEGGGLKFSESLVNEENDALGAGLGYTENKNVFLSSVDMYDKLFRKVGTVSLAQPLIMNKKNSYKIKVEIDV